MSQRDCYAILGLLFFSQVLPSGAQAQPCPKPDFHRPEQVLITGEAALIVTHPSIAFDGRMASKIGVDAAVRAAKKQNVPVLYLLDDGPISDYFFGDCSPDYWLYSGGGELNIDFQPAHLYTVGGHWELCQSKTLHDVLLLWSRQPKKNRRVTTYMDGVYMKGSMSFEDKDPYFNDYAKFIGIVNYGRPGLESFNNKLTLQEAMGIIIKEKLQLEFLTRILPHYERTLPDYRVELKLNDSPSKLLQKGKGPNPPILVFEFLDSAMSSGPR